MVDFLGNLDKSLYFLVSGYLRIIVFLMKKIEQKIRKLVATN